MKNEYRQKTDENRINRIRSITNGLPKACMDFIRSISMSTSTLTRLAYAYDLRVFFNFLIAERILFADMTLTTFTDEKIALISQSDMELYMEYLSVYYSQMTSDENGTITKPLYNHEMGVSRKLSTLRSFFQYLYKSNRIPANITTLIPIPKLHDKPILSMDKNEVFKILFIK